MEINACKIGRIKSRYILKFIFRHLNKNKNLEIIRYNKLIQQRTTVNIEDYKKQGKRYKIGEKNGYGREYKLDTNILLFEGEYFNSRKNGKGKEYYEDGKIKFEGEYKKGKKVEGKCYNNEGEIFLVIVKDSKGKELFNNGNLKFEGEYLNGKRWKGKGYNYDGKEEFEIKNGEGFIKEYDDIGKLLFEGDYLNGERNGKGKEYYKNGNLKF